MSNLRIIGLLVGIAGLLFTFKLFRGPRWNRLNFLISGFFSLSLIIVSVNPNVLNILAQILTFDMQQRGRILTLLIGSNIILWFLFVYFKTRLDEYRYQFDILVRNLAKEEIEDLRESELVHSDVIVVIPAYNEEQSLKEMLPYLPKSISGKKVGAVIIDDASTDGTANVGRDAGHLVACNKTRRGGGGCLKIGLRYRAQFEASSHSNHGCRWTT